MHRGGVTPLPPRPELAAARAATVCGARVAPAARRGVTLLELLVVLLLLGLAAALVAPVLRLPVDGGAGAAGRAAGRGAGGLARAADAARELALRRGESVVLRVAPGGEWTVVPAVVAAVADTAPLLAGRLDEAPARALRVVVSPLGTCVPDVPAGAADARAAVDDAVWDAGACRPASRATATR